MAVRDSVFPEQIVLLPAIIIVGGVKRFTLTVCVVIQLELPRALIVTVVAAGFKTTAVPVKLPGVHVYPNAFPKTEKFAELPGQTVGVTIEALSVRLVTAMVAEPTLQPTCATTE